MNTNYVIGGVAAVVVLGGILWFVVGGTGGAALQGSTSGSLADLAKRGGTWQCSVQHEGASDTSSGVVYISGQKVRGDFSSQVEGAGKVDTHMIADGENVYVWTSMFPSGFKTKVSMANDGGTATEGGQDFYNQSYDYDCKPWPEDRAKFTPPTNVTFNDMSAAAGVGAGAGAGAGKIDCSVCDQAGPGKEQCLIALKCQI